MTTYHAVELLLVGGIVGAAAWHVWRRWRATRRPAAGAACSGCARCPPPVG